MSKLILVPTPIGNLKDITLRAVEILKSVDYILTEDTRKSGILLNHYDIKNNLRRFHKFNEHNALEKIMADLQSGKHIAMITDAGTPGISDPGFLIVRECVRQDVAVETLPGPTAFIPALVNSGIPCDRFVFEGFLPQKKGRNTRLKLLKEESRTMVFYESPYRLAKTLEQFKAFFGGERQVSISRELSKIYEETIRGSINEILEIIGDKELKGEIVIIMAGSTR